MADTGKVVMILETDLALIGLALKQAKIALEIGRPVMDHYPEPKDRHKTALQLVSEANTIIQNQYHIGVDIVEQY